MPINASDSYEFVFENVPVILIFIMRFTAILILLLNGIVLLLVSLTTHTIPKIYTLQMACLCVTDMNAGVSLLVCSFIDHDFFGKDSIRCSTVIGYFLMSQSTTLYNLMAICINRFFILIRMDRMVQHLTKTKVIVFTTCASVFALIVCVIPFARWAPIKEEFGVNGCSMDTAFHKHTEAAKKVFFATFLIPLMITNILYGSLLAKLHRKERRIRPESQPGSHSTLSKAVTMSTITQDSINMGDGKDINRTAVTSIDTTLTAGPSMCGSGNKLSVNTADGNPMAFAGKKDKQNRWNTIIRPSFKSTTSTTQALSERRSHQRKAFILIGFILLFLNIFTWPGVLVLLMEFMIESWSLSRGIKIPLFCIIGFNSLVNPILYTIRVAEFRKVLSSTFCVQTH